MVRGSARSTPTFLLALYAALAASPLLLLVLGAPPPSRGFAVELAAGLGYIALAMLSLQLALGARPRSITNALGLDAVLLFHRAAGLWLTAFVIAHLALLAFAEKGFVLHLLAVHADPPHGVAFWLALAGLALLVLVPRQLTRLRIPYEAWRVAHALVAVFVLVIALWHVRLVGRSSATPAKQAAITALALAGPALLAVARLVRPALALRRPWQVAEVREERPRVWTLVLEALDHDGLHFRPGQSVWLTLGRSPFSPRQHPFTVASSAASPRRVELTIKELGDFTREIGRVPVGTRAFLAGPHGAFALDPDDARPLVCIAGGIGVTPMMSMIRTLRDLGDRRPVLLLYGSGSPEKIVFAAELDELARTMNLGVVHVLESAPPGWTGERGTMDGALLSRHLAGVVADAEIFVCGPEPMMNLVERALGELKVRGDHVHTEHFALVGSRPPGGRSLRERHVRALSAALALFLVTAATLVAVART
jgi:predicted ferric reductase